MSEKTIEEYYQKCLDSFGGILEQLTHSSELFLADEISDKAEAFVSAMLDEKPEEGSSGNLMEVEYQRIVDCIQLGTIYGALYREHPEEFAQNADYVTAGKLAFLSSGVLMSTNFNLQQVDMFYSFLYDQWNKLIDPDWTYEENRDYFIASYKAVCQFGVANYMQFARALRLSEHSEMDSFATDLVKQ